MAKSSKKTKKSKGDVLGPIREDLTGIEVSLRDMKLLENDLARVRKNLRRFLTRAQKLASGNPHKIPGNGG